MALQQVTYKTIVDVIKTFLVNECSNVGTNYSTITNQWFHYMNEPTWTAAPHVYSGYVYWGHNSSIGVSNHEPFYKIWSVSNVTQYSVDSVKADVTNFVANILGINENAIIPSTNDFYNFLGNMLSYVSYRTGFVVSTMSQSTVYMIFLVSGDPPVTNLSKDEKIAAAQITRLFNIVMDIEYQKGRIVSMTNSALMGDFEKNIYGLTTNGIKSSQNYFV